MKTDRKGVALNKNKVVSLAQRFTAKGQLEKAIAEYRKIIQVDPGDIRTWLKIGDLYTRMGARKEATDTYIRVAEQYTNSGFHLKAIAVYKQILNIDPTLVIVHQYLAAAYLELGLTSEALIQLEQLADVYERTGREDAFLDILMHMGKIDPHNIATRLRVAELYSKQNRVAEAANQFSLACDELKKQGRREDFIKVAERLLYHDPNRVDIAQEMAAIYLERGRYKEALAKLQICFAKAPKNTDVLSLLASAFDGLGQPEKAISVYLEISEILKEQGEMARRQRILKEILALDPNHEAARAALDEFEPENDYPDEDIEIDTDDAVEDIEIWDEDAVEPELSPEELAAKSVERLGEVQVLIKYGLKERALDHLGKIFVLDPYNIDARELAKDLLLELGRTDEALEHLFLLAEAFEDSQPEGSIYYLHEVLKIDENNQRARQIIQELGGIMPEGMSDPPQEMDVEVEEEILLLDDDEDIVLIDNEDLEQADAMLDDAAQGNPADWNALEPSLPPNEPQDEVMILDGESGDLSGRIEPGKSIAEIFDDSGMDDSEEEEILDEASDDSVDPSPHEDAPRKSELTIDDPFGLDTEDSGLSTISEYIEGDETRLLVGSAKQETLAELSETAVKPDEQAVSPEEQEDAPFDMDASVDTAESTETAADDIITEKVALADALLEEEEEPSSQEVDRSSDSAAPASIEPLLLDTPITEEELASSTEEELEIVPDTTSKRVSSAAPASLIGEETQTEESVPSTRVEEVSTPPTIPEDDGKDDQTEVMSAPPDAPLDDTSAPPPAEKTEETAEKRISSLLDSEDAINELLDAAVFETPIDAGSDSEEESATPQPDIDDELEEIEFFLSQDLMDEAKMVLSDLLTQYPKDKRLVTLKRQIMGDEEDTSASPSQTSEADAASAVSSKRNSEGSVLFKNVGVKETLSDSDSNTAWDLGLAYKEMGLLDDAIQAFEIAAKDTTKTAPAKTMLGMCYASLGQQDKAVKTFVDGLAIEEIDKQQRMGLLYELGKTYEMMQLTDKALSCFQDIVSIDPTFADVANRINVLSDKFTSTNTTS